MRSLSFAITFAILALWITPVAHAETFTDPEADFRIDVPVAPGERPCVAFPASRTVASDCAGVDLAPLRSRAPAKPVGAILLKGPLLVQVVREESMTARPAHYDRLHNNMVRGVRSSLPKGTTFVEDHRWVASHNGADVVAIDGELRSSAQTLFMVIANVPIDGGSYSIATSGPKSSRADVEALMADMLDSMQVTPPLSVDEEDPSMQDPAYRMGYRAGETLSWIFTGVWWLVSLALILVIGIRGHNTWRALPDGPSTASTESAAPSVRGPVVNPFKRDSAKGGALPSTFFGGYDGGADKKRDA